MDTCCRGGGGVFIKKGYNWCNLVYILIKVCMHSLLLYFNKDITISRFAKGSRGILPRENLYKWCKLISFGVYFDHISSFKIIWISIFL